MNKPETTTLDVIFVGLAHPHRREIVYALSLQPYSISQLATQRNLSLPAIHKHIKVLKAAQLITDKKIGRVHVLTLNRAALRTLQEWVMQYHPYWGTPEETLENYAPYLSKANKRKEVDK